MSAPMQFLRDLALLAKPRITMMSVMVAAGAAGLAPGTPELSSLLWALLGIGLIVGAANAWNQYLERDVDAKMNRTRQRPLPQGRLAPAVGLGFAVVTAVLALAVLWLKGNAITALVGLLALINYVFVYTPLKRRTSWALHVGTLSGAAPVLMGWTAMTGGFEAAGLVLFSLMVVWQLPHFLAIALFRQDEYAAAGLVVAPHEHGDDATRRVAVAYATALLPISLLLVPLHVAGWAYAAVAVVVNLMFMGMGASGVINSSGRPWARRFFAASLVYPVGIVLAFLADLAIS
ncbi:MAG: heme o synthase [Acidobacteriota bacterium]